MVQHVIQFWSIMSQFSYWIFTCVRVDLAVIVMYIVSGVSRCLVWGGQMAQVLVIGLGHGKGPGRGVPRPWVRGLGQSPRSFWIYRSLYVSFSVLWQNLAAGNSEWMTTNFWSFAGSVWQIVTNLVQIGRSSYSYLDRFILHRGDPPYTYGM